ncbi:hypothetical protein N7495_010050 [Penicillium taxi]|uniref:uncharacterized protein n=1 Tax=Penicillium taxi TaxID=168475 RepID=UPI002544D6FE|nr:uncharacterized protein N7495_010050 [Penicillium taxi]KAJ5885540.1 hypothetical protein N7495_010050 [Penicillium taxi]
MPLPGCLERPRADEVTQLFSSRDLELQCNCNDETTSSEDSLLPACRHGVAGEGWSRLQCRECDKLNCIAMRGLEQPH